MNRADGRTWLPPRCEHCSSWLAAPPRRYGAFIGAEQRHQLGCPHGARTLWLRRGRGPWHPATTEERTRP